MTTSRITTHILDLARGKPAAHVEIVLERLENGQAQRMGHGRTDNDGRLRTLLHDGQAFNEGTYRLTFAVGDYFRIHGMTSFYDLVPIEFKVTNAEEHHHVPLLVSPHGYSTYRGS